MAKVKVKILKYVGEFSPGQEVEVEEELAKHLCAVKEIWNGEKLEQFQNAMLLSEATKMKESPIDIDKMTAADMAAIGAKNIVHVPPDAKKQHDDYLKSIGVIKAAAKKEEVVEEKKEEAKKGK